MYHLLIVFSSLLGLSYSQGPVDCSLVLDINNPQLVLFSYLTRCLFDATGSTDPKAGEYYDIENIPGLLRKLALIGPVFLETSKFYQPNALGRRAFGLDIATYRRPPSENTPANINRAASYAMYRVSDALFPWAKSDHRKYFVNKLQLDPDDNSLNWTTPTGIGNQVGKAVTGYMHNDGMNQLGDRDCNYYNGQFGHTPVTYSRQYNRMNYSDYTCYTSANTAERFFYPNRWQPNSDFYDRVTWISQKFAMPQFANVVPYSNIDIEDLVNQMPGPYLWPHHTYTDQALDLVYRSGNLTDEQKMIAEFFNNKSLALKDVTGYFFRQQLLAGNIHKPSIAIAKAVTLTTSAWLDGGIFSWNVKRKFDYVRPFSAIRFLFKDDDIQAWAKNEGTKTMKGIEWTPYLVTGNFPDYTSTTTCLTYAQSRLYSLIRGGTSNWNYSITFPKGSSLVEPGVTPTNNITVTFPTLDDFELAASESRMNAGLHFLAASVHPREICHGIGQAVYDQWLVEMNGDPVLDGV